MPDKGTILGTHHVTYCAGGAQDDYDFHVGFLGLQSIKKTVLFDGEIPIYHLYYARPMGDGFSSVLTSFPYRQSRIAGKRGTNQMKRLNLSIAPESLAFWADRLQAHGMSFTEIELFGTQRLVFTEPSGIEFAFVAEISDPREPRPLDNDVPPEHAVRGVHGSMTSLMDPEPMHFFLTRAFGGEKVASDGAYHQYRVGAEEGSGRMVELVEEPGRAQGSWWFGEGTIHHHAFDAVSSENQAVVKDRIVGLGFTDVSDVKDRGYFHSVYLRTPGGALFELAVSTPQGFLIDEPREELGTHMCIPPHWEHRRAEIGELEPIRTRERVEGGAPVD